LSGCFLGGGFPWCGRAVASAGDNLATIWQQIGLASHRLVATKGTLHTLFSLIEAAGIASAGYHLGHIIHDASRIIDY